jgi:hypothetical protein
LARCESRGFSAFYALIVIPGEREARGKGTQVNRPTRFPKSILESRLRPKRLHHLGPLPSRFALAGDDSYFLKEMKMKKVKR